jgi:DnaJ-class molecular chaperone
MRKNKAARTLCVAAAAATLAAEARRAPSLTGSPYHSTTTRIPYEFRGGESVEDSSANRKKARRRKKKTKSSDQSEQPTTSSPVEPTSNDAHDSPKDQASSATHETLPESSTAKQDVSSSKEIPNPQHPTNPPTSSSSPPNPLLENIINETDYYAILGLSKAQVASSHRPAAEVITKAYRKRAVLTHPDKTNGDRRAFDKVAEAYDILQNDEKRQLYDRFGKRGLNQAGGGSSSFFASAHTPDDLFRSFFGGANPFFGAQQSQPQQAARRNRTTRYQLSVTLEDLYHGAVRTALVAPERPYQRASSSSSKRVQVQIQRGALAGQSIVLSGEMDFDPTAAPGDLVFIVQQERHAVFTRRAHDLAMTLTIPLSEAVRGVQGRTIRHLNGQDILISSGDAGTIRTGDVQVLKGHGMPKNAQGTEFGDLYVQYEVSIPLPQSKNSLSSHERNELGRLLDKLEGRKSELSKKRDDPTVHVLTPASVADFGVASGTIPTPESPAEEEERYSSFDRRFFFSANPFSSGDQQQQAREEDDGNAQCRQM